MEKNLKKVMIVDDEPAIRLSVREGLKSMNAEYEIVEADGAKECFNKLDNEQLPDLILLDIMMPEMDGWEVFDKLKDNPSWNNIPIIFLTARADDIAKKAGSFMAVDYIEKPFDLDDLKNRIDKVI